MSVAIDEVDRMGAIGDGERRRVLVPQALGADQFLRVTWHAQRRLLVFSHWEGDHCVAATPVRVSDAAELAELMVSAITSNLAPRSLTWEPPHPRDLVTVDLPSERSA